MFSRSLSSLLVLSSYLSSFAYADTAITYNASTEIIFQVDGPLEDYGAPVYSQSLGPVTIANTYGQSPEQLQYTAPGSNIEFTNVEITITGTNFGRQYDRLGHVYVGGVEVWRPSTPEPRHDNITWTFTKDVSEFLELFKTSQEVLVEIGNVVTDVYTGIIHVSIDINLFNNGERVQSYTTNNIYDEDLPANSIQYFGDSLYTDESIESSWVNTLAQVPRNTTRLVANIFASGNSDEEFWYGNVMDEIATALDWYGSGPTRRVEVLVDDTVAGFAYPFPIVYTGGISPYFWSPIVGINAYEVPAYQIELTPFLPYLWEANTNITIRVVNGYNDEAMNSDWLISCSILGWQHQGVHGSGDISKTDFTTTNYTGYTGTDSSVPIYEAVEITSDITNTAKLSFGQNLDYEVSWTQSGSSQNIQVLTDNGYSQDIAQTSAGNDKFSYKKTLSGNHNRNWETTMYTKEFSYPILTDQAYIATNGSSEYNMNITRVYYNVVNDKYVSTIQNATSELIYVASLSGWTGYGSNTQTLSQLAYGSLYEQTAGAVNGTLVYNTTSQYPSSNANAVPNYHDYYNKEIQSALDGFRDSGDYESFWPIFLSSGDAQQASFPTLPECPLPTPGSGSGGSGSGSGPNVSPLFPATPKARQDGLKGNTNGKGLW